MRAASRMLAIDDCEKESTPAEEIVGITALRKVPRRWQHPLEITLP